MKDTYTRAELPCADFLMSFQQGLLDDFIKHQGSLSHPQHEDYILRYKDCRKDIPEEQLAQMFLTRKNNEWVNDADVGYGVGIKHAYQKYTVTCKEYSDLQTFYPTATKLIDHYRDKCSNAIYSVLRPYTIFKTHTDNELIGRNLLRIHIPLNIPGGEMFMQFGDKKMYWSDIFGFNGLSLHSANNLTENWGMIFLMDLEIDAAGI